MYRKLYDEVDTSIYTTPGKGLENGTRLVYVVVTQKVGGKAGSGARL